MAEHQSDLLEKLPAERPGTNIVSEPDHSVTTEGTYESKIEADDSFDWAADASVLLGEQLATAVYRNRAGGIVIRQECVDGGDDHFIVLRDADAVHLLVPALLREVKGGQQ